MPESGRSSVVEHLVANENVDSSNLFTRSILKRPINRLVFFFALGKSLLTFGVVGSALANGQKTLQSLAQVLILSIQSFTLAQQIDQHRNRYPIDFQITL